ncbi:MAG: methyltransferase domain-containing protein, partial [Haliea sp.]|nr:methyltransferase domain-containing protein [Haliea sp.]
KAVDLAGLSPSEPLKIADIGCGTGASTMQLARALNARITAVDFSSDFLEVLEADTEEAGLSERIKSLLCSMETLPFEDEEYDVFWSEGAVYNMGFENGVNSWRHFLRPGGLLVVSEITWTTGDRPSEVQKFWESAYPEIATAADKISVLERSGYSPIAYFTLPESSWIDNYYRPLQDSFPGFLARHANSDKARAIVEAEEKEITLYMKFKSYYSYGVYIARKT